jgi:hypothetical protein
MSANVLARSHEQAKGETRKAGSNVNRTSSCKVVPSNLARYLTEIGSESKTRQVPEPAPSSPSPIRHDIINDS